MNELNKKFLEAGWIQVGEGIPVYFKYDLSNKEFPFQIIFPVDAAAHFYLYQKWLDECKITVDQLPDVNMLINSAFTSTFVIAKCFHTALLTTISDYYYHNEGFNSEKKHEYEEITKCVREYYVTTKPHHSNSSNLR